MSKHVVRVVTLASRKGRYGGPFDTATNQGALLRASGWDAVVIAGHLAGDAPPSSDHLESPPVAPVVKGLGFQTIFSIGMVRALWRQIGTAEVVHVSAARELVPVAAATIAVLRRRPLVLQPHGMLTSRTSRAHRVIDLFVRQLFRRADAFIALTTDEETKLRAWLNTRQTASITVLGNPLLVNDSDLRALRAQTPSGGAVFIARLHARKRVTVFAAAAQLAAGNSWPDRYNVYGPDEGDLSNLLTITDSVEQLSYHGVLTPLEVPQILSQAEVFVLPSADEPWGNVLATALALGIPSVVCESAALSELVRGLPNCRVIPDADPEALANAVHECLHLPRLSESSLPPFNERSLADSLTAIYRGAIARNGH